MSQLPRVDAQTDAEIRAWLEKLAVCVREVDYATARPMWDEDVVVFGTFNRLLHGIDAFITAQWDNVWPKTTDFRFTMSAVEVLGMGDIAVAVAPWTSTGYAPDGASYARPGRATMMFTRRPDGWRCVHSHMSLERGVPQTSHANRPVKAH
ncbi:YybH family protein [Humitalea sp. 24SJ18S-53]|uniref:YybH family protein n=1 Tax=Humitalea sp. 24SJ18S-53 TaxID=3422307 RepID=UPI003D67C1E4